MVTAYAYAVSKGYTGTEAEFAELMASYASVAQEAVDAALAAASARDTAQTTVAGAIAGIQAEGQTQVDNVNAAGATQIAAVEAKGRETRESIPDDYTTLANTVNSLSDEIANVKDAVEQIAPYYDETSGEYTATSIKNWLRKKHTGLAYGVQIPMSSATQLTKLGANANFAVPTLAVGNEPGNDPYFGIGPFFWHEVNGYVDADGTPHVTAIRGDNRFSRTNAQTWILTPVLYYSMTNDGESIYLYISDEKLSGYVEQPGAILPSENVRPYMLYAKYALGEQEGGVGAGYANTKSGLRPWIQNVSHNTLITHTVPGTTGYSGKTVDVDWYMKVMFMMKYATKNSQTYFPQCSSYYLEYPITVATTDEDFVIISTANAANLVIGSSVGIGRSKAFYKIVSIEPYDADNSKITLEDFTGTATTEQKLDTMHWFTGACDALETDGILGEGAKYPCMMQGIEFGNGMYECLGDVIISSDGETGWIPYVVDDTINCATSLTGHYESTDLPLPMGDTDSWKYGLYMLENHGLLVPTGVGGSTSAGLCDGQYTNKTATTGTREWLGLGHLGYGGTVGLCYVDANLALGSAYWGIGSRLSATGRRG